MRLAQVLRRGGSRDHVVMVARQAAQYAQWTMLTAQPQTSLHQAAKMLLGAAQYHIREHDTSGGSVPSPAVPC